MPMVLAMLNVDFVRRDTVLLRAMVMAYLKVLGRCWLVVEARAGAIDVGWKCEKWVVLLGLCAWGSSGGELKGLAAVLAFLRSFGGERGGMAAF